MKNVANGCLPDGSADRSVVDMARDSTLVKSHDLQVTESAPGLRSAFGQGRPQARSREVWGRQKKRTNRIDLPLSHVLVHNVLDEVGIPPDPGVVLQLWVVQGDASLGVDAQGMARALELLNSCLAQAVVVALLSTLIVSSVISSV
jgi:hypothetical protein